MIDVGERIKCLFQIFQYVPDPVRNEFVNIGVVIRAVEPEVGPFSTQLRFTRNWRRVRCLDPGADTIQLEAIEQDLIQRLSADPDGLLMRILNESLSLGIQITEPKAFLAENLEAGIAELMQTLVEAPAHEHLRGREAILAKMHEEFERADVWGIVRRRISASDFTQPGDSLQIDIGYSHMGIAHWFHAVSLATDAEMAKALAFSFLQLSAGLERVKTRLELTAVVESPSTIADCDNGFDREDLFQFGVETMRAQGICVATTDDLGTIAETARTRLNSSR